MFIRKCTRSLICILIILLMVVLPSTSLLTVSATTSVRTVRVGFFKFDGFNIVNDDGTFSGYGYDYLCELSKFTGWNYEFIYQKNKLDGTNEDLTYEDCLKMLEEGEIDVLGSVRKTSERENVFFFPDASAGDNTGMLTVRNDDTTAVAYDITTLNTYTIGLLKGSSRNDEIKKFCIDNKISCTFFEYESNETLKNALLQSKQIDAVYSSNLRKTSDERIILYMKSSPFYFVANKNNTEVCSELEYGVNQIAVYQPELKTELNEKYYRDSSSRTLFLTEDEKKYISENPVVKLGVSSDFFPFENLSGRKYTGISADIINQISELTGLKFEIVEKGSWEDTIEAVNNKDIDVIAALCHDYTYAAENNLKLTTPYTSVTVSAIAHDDFTSITDSTKIAVVKNAYITELVKKKYPDSSFITYDTVEECINRVNRKKCDITFVTNYCSDYYSSYPKYTRIKTFTIKELEFSLSIASSSNNNFILYQIINKALLSIPQSTVDAYIYENTVNADYEDSILSIIYKYPQASLMVLSSIVIMLILFIVILLNNRKRHQENVELEMKVKREQASNEAKTEFLSKISHEMRTPLNTISLAAEVAMSDITVNEQEAIKHIENIQISSKYLVAMINDILDMAKIESNKLILEQDTVNLNSLINQLSQIYAAYASHKGVVMTTEMFDETVYVISDSKRIEQILVNLLSNAIKFTDAGDTVILKLKIIDRSEDKSKVTIRFSVTDSGCGISEDEQKLIFERFEQGEKGRKSGSGGTGLGLAISQNIARLMDSTINVKSQKGQGSCFWFDVEFQLCNANSEQEDEEKKFTSSVDFGQRRVLLAEDHIVNSMIIKKLLENKNANVDIAKNGQIAFDKFKSSEKGYYSAILMDIRMPVMDGYEATKAIRSCEHSDAQSIPIISMSANVLSEDADAAINCGMNAHIAKPIDIHHFYHTLCEMMGMLQSNSDKN